GHGIRSQAYRQLGPNHKLLKLNTARKECVKNRQYIGVSGSHGAHADDLSIDQLHTLTWLQHSGPGHRQIFLDREAAWGGRGFCFGSEFSDCHRRCSLRRIAVFMLPSWGSSRKSKTAPIMADCT